MSNLNSKLKGDTQRMECFFKKYRIKICDTKFLKMVSKIGLNFVKCQESQVESLREKFAEMLAKHYERKTQ